MTLSGEELPLNFSANWWGTGNLQQIMNKIDKQIDTLGLKITPIKQSIIPDCGPDWQSFYWIFQGFSTGINNSIKKEQIPSTKALLHNYPNPFNSSTFIKFHLPESDNVILKIYNLLGKEIQTITNGYLNAGDYVFSWDASDMATGLYLCKLETGTFSKTIKILLIK